MEAFDSGMDTGVTFGILQRWRSTMTLVRRCPAVIKHERKRDLVSSYVENRKIIVRYKSVR